MKIPQNVTLTTDARSMQVKGPKGEQHRSIPLGIQIHQEGDTMLIKRSHEDKRSKALHGFMRAQLANDITGVANGWTKILELSGVGYRAALSGADLVLTVGFSHPVTIAPPSGIQFSIAEGKIVVWGVDKQTVGQIAAIIRGVKVPEPYKGKGIKYQGEYIRKKAGKAAKAVGGAK